MARTYQYRPIKYTVQDHSGAGVLATAISADVYLVHLSTSVDAYIKLEGTAANKDGLLLSANDSITMKTSPSDSVSAYATGAGQISVTEMSS